MDNIGFNNLDSPNIMELVPKPFKNILIDSLIIIIKKIKLDIDFLSFFLTL